MGRRMERRCWSTTCCRRRATGSGCWSFKGRVAVRLGYDQALLAEVVGALARAVMHDMRWAVKERHGLGSWSRYGLL